MEIIYALDTRWSTEVVALPMAWRVGNESTGDTYGQFPRKRARKAARGTQQSAPRCCVLRTFVRRGSWIGALALAALAFSACARPPAVVVDTAMSKDTLRLLVVKPGGDKPEARIIRCHRGPDGALSQCVAMPVVLEGQ